MKTTISVFFSALFLLTQSLFGQTPVSGNITTNTTWTAANSPYIITAYTQVDFGVTLTIDPGVVVEFDDGQLLWVEGNLFAEGNETDSIFFKSSNATPFPGIYGGVLIYGNGSNITRFKYIHSEYASSFFLTANNYSNVENSRFSMQDTGVSIQHFSSIDTFQTIKNCVFNGNNIGFRLSSTFSSSTVQVEDCIFKNNEYGAVSFLDNGGNGIEINNSIFDGNDYGATIDQSKITHSLFYDNIIVAVSEEDSEIQSCTFTNNEVGIITLLSSTTDITLNNFDNNVVGVRVGPTPINDPFATFKTNTICNSQLYNAEIDSNPGVTVDLTGNCWCETDLPTIGATIFDSNDDPSTGTISFSPIDNSTCSPNLVYPGDANYDQVANAFDILAIGVKYDETGPIRPNASLSWGGQGGLNWADTLANGTNLKHTDCNGDGTIDSVDIDAINLNYGLTHTSSRPSNNNGIPLAFSLPAGSYNPGETVTIPVTLGTSALMANNLYGIAFTVLYDTSLIEEGSISVSYANSWLGTKGTDLITIDHDSYTDGQLDIGLTRIDHLPQSGFGSIIEITVVIDEDIAKTSYPIVFSFGEIRAINPDENDIPVEGESAEGNVTTGISDVLASTVRIFPNPANNSVRIDHNRLKIKEIVLLNIAGQTIQIHSLQGTTQTQLDLSYVPSGLYFLTIISEEGTLTKKLTISH